MIIAFGLKSEEENQCFFYGEYKKTGVKYGIITIKDALTCKSKPFMDLKEFSWNFLMKEADKAQFQRSNLSCGRKFI